MEPVEPKPPPHAFTLFAKSKWSVLVGEKKDRLEQAKLMWRALELSHSPISSPFGKMRKESEKIR